MLSLGLAACLVCSMAVPVAASSYFYEGTYLEGRKDFYYEVSANCSTSSASARIDYMGTYLTGLTLEVESSTGITKKTLPNKSKGNSYTIYSPGITVARAEYRIDGNMVDSCTLTA